MSTKKIDELLKANKEKTRNLNVEEETHLLTEQLKNEEVFEYTDYSLDDLKVIDFANDFEPIEIVKKDEKLDLRKKEEPKEIEVEMKTEEIRELDALDELLNQESSVEESKSEKQVVKDYSNNPIMVNFDNVTMRYNKVDRLIEGLNLKIYEGEFIYLVGPSGSGKSTLSRLIYRDVTNTAGTVWVDGINATTLKPGQLHKLRQKIGVIFQDYKLLPNLTIYENVKYTLDVIGYPKDKIEEQVLKTLQRVGIKEQRDKFPKELSGGQQQRAAIARAIVNEPKIIVADEPTGNLDPKNADIIMKILERINKGGTTVIMATHDTKIVNKFKHRTIKIESGSIKGENKEGGYIYE